MLAVIGCGNPNRTDDGAGLHVIRILRQNAELSSRSDVMLLDAGTDGIAVMFAARGCTSLIVVDCCKTGAEPGTMFEIPGHELESPHQPTLSLHDFRWEHAVYAGRQMYREAFPKDVTAFLIEARSLEFGLALSADITVAAEKVAQKIETRIASLPEIFCNGHPA